MKNKINLVDEAIRQEEMEELISERKRHTALRREYSRRHKRICPPPSSFDYPIYKELKDVIICNDLSKVSPRRWDELEIDFSNRNKRYCTHLNRSVLKVTNQHNYDAIKNDDICIAVPYNGVLHKTLDEKFQQYIQFYAFIQISRRLQRYSGYSERYDIHETDMKNIVESMISYIYHDIKDGSWRDMDHWIKKYQEFGIDLNAIQ